MGVKIREKPKGSGVYWVFINHNGKRKAKKIGKDKRLAREMAKKIDAKLVLGEFGLEDNKTPKFKEYTERWLLLPHDVKQTTIDEYRNKFRLYVFPAIGRLTLSEIDKARLQSLFDGLAIKGLKTTTSLVAKSALNEVLKHALAGNLIQSNPLNDLTLKKKKHKFRADPLNEQELETLLKTALEYKAGKYYPVMLTAVRTGMRVGELVALKWTDIDFENRVIKVQRSFVINRMSTPKNHQFRDVDMTPLLSDVLRQLKIDRKKWALKNGRAVPEFVFLTDAGKILHSGSFRYALNRCLKLAKLKHIRIHDLRHSYATIRLLRGHNIGDISYQLGHSSLSFTYDIYGHWIPGRFKSEVDELDQTQPNATYPQPKNRRK